MILYRYDRSKIESIVGHRSAASVPTDTRDQTVKTFFPTKKIAFRRGMKWKRTGKRQAAKSRWIQDYPMLPCLHLFRCRTT
jgi:hypothetical protein